MNALLLVTIALATIAPDATTVPDAATPREPTDTQQLKARLDDAWKKSAATNGNPSSASDAPDPGAATTTKQVRNSGESPAPLTLKPADSGSSAQWIGGVLLLGGAGAAALWARRRRGKELRGLRVLDATSLGKGRDLVVVEHDGRRLLLGVTATSIAVLVDGPSLPAAALPSSPASAGASATQAFGIAAFERELADAEARAPQGVHVELSAGRSTTTARGEAARSEGDELRQKLAATSSSRRPL